MTQASLNMLGMAMRAGKVVTGEERVVQAIRKQQATLVLLAEDGSHNTRKKITDKCRSYQVPLQYVENRTVLGRSIGKDERVVVAVTDQGFGQQILKRIEE